MQKINLRFSILALIVILAGLSRLVIHVDNFTPIGAMAIFGGAYFTDKWKAAFTTLFSLFLSDMIIQGVFYQGQYGFPLYSGWYWVYGTFVLIVFLGKWIITKVNIGNIAMASVVAALTHWVITDFGVWYSGCNVAIYPKNWAGFILCYEMAIPYMASFLMGTLFYSAIFFGVFELAQRRFPVLAKVHY